jgi:hypothetical protein
MGNTVHTIFNTRVATIIGRIRGVIKGASSAGRYSIIIGLKLPKAKIAIISPIAPRPFKPPATMLRMPAVVAFQVLGAAVTISTSSLGHYEFEPSIA